MSKGQYRMKSNYVSGSNALKLDGVYSSYKHEKNEQAVITPKKATPKVEKSVNKANRLCTFALVFVIMATMAVVVVMLKTQFIVSDKSEEIISLQQQLIDVKRENIQLESEISKGIDMNEVYIIATQELGMVQPTAENIQYVDGGDTSYTVQYSGVDVDEDSAGVNIGNVLGFISQGW
jgi:cell division protein FtsL